MTLRDQIAKSDHIVEQFKQGTLTIKQAYKELELLEKKAYDEDKDAEPDGDYTYTVAVAMEEIENFDKMENTPQNLNDLLNQNNEEESHFEDIEQPKLCKHPSHNPPMHLHIPFGKRYIHICPACRQRTVLQPPQLTWSAHKEIKDPRTILKENGQDFSWMSSRYTENVIVSCMEQYANQFKTQ